MKKRGVTSQLDLVTTQSIVPAAEEEKGRPGDGYQGRGKREPTFSAFTQNLIEQNPLPYGRGDEAPSVRLNHNFPFRYAKIGTNCLQEPVEGLPPFPSV